jgi:NAD(P)-dependent dehydrogenase (short-subunit alcohol dehydrogenase family)
MSGRLQGRTALVTGSSRGIGAAIARAFAAEGARVAVAYREREQDAAALAAELKDGLCLRLDVTRRSEVRSALDTIHDRWGGLDILVNNAGLLQQKPFAEITDEDWDRTLEVNLKGVFLCTQEAAPRLCERPSASIINISSIGGQFGGPRAPHYSASKAAVLAFTRSTARLFAHQGLRVNAIAPGFVRTEMIEDVLAGDGEERALAQIPLGRLGAPGDIAAAAVYLASEDAGFVTGQVLSVNGGQLML